MSSESFVCVRAGRFVELYVRRLSHIGDIEALQAALSAEIRIAGPEAVICSDYRLASPVTPEVAGALARAMRQNNGRMTRGGLLLAPSNTVLNLQIERVVKCAGNPGRRAFVDPEELRRWVGHEASGAERKALDGFFSHADAPR
jgi:hypothetical protein